MAGFLPSLLARLTQAGTFGKSNLFTRLVDKLHITSPQSINTDHINDLRSAGLTFDNMSFVEEQTATSPPRKKQKTTNDLPDILVCEICDHNIEGDAYSRPCRLCQRIKCHDCIRRWFTHALNDREQMPVRCCERVIHFAIAEGILSKDVVEKYKSRWDEMAADSPIYCPVPRCSAFQPPRTIQVTNENTFDCIKCGIEICFKCRQLFDNDHVCASDDEKEDIIDRYDYKQCPKCRTGVMKMFGCNHVRCQCGAHWCYNCVRPTDMCERRPCHDGLPEVSDSDEEASDDEIPELPPPSTRTVRFAPAFRQSESQSAPNGQDAQHQEIANIPTPIVQSEPSQQQSLLHSLIPSEPFNDQYSHPLPTVATTNIEPTTQSPTDTLAQPPEAVDITPSMPNLDASDREDWEAGNYDFGDEPDPNEKDIWGCNHKYYPFPAFNRLPKKWLVGPESRKIESVACLRCFKDTPLGQSSQKEAVMKVKVGEKARSDLPQRLLEAGEEVAPGAADREEQAKIQGVKEKQIAYECTSCGAVHCYECRKASLRKLHAWKSEKQN